MIKTFRRKSQTFIEGHKINTGIFLFVKEKAQCYKYQGRLLIVFLSWWKQLYNVALLALSVPSLLHSGKQSDLTDKSGKFFFLNKFIYFIYLFLAVLGLCYCTRAFSSCGEWGLPFVAVRGLLIAVASLVVEHRLQVHGLQQLWRTGLVALRHVGSSWTRAQNRVPCIGRWILNHCTTREVPIWED